MRFVLTAVETLFPDHPDLEGDLDGLFRRGIPEKRLQSIILKKHGVSIPLPQIWKYRVKRWVPSVRRIERDTERWQAVFQAAKKELRNAPRMARSWRRRDLPSVMMFIAQELYGESWQDVLRQQLMKRFRTAEIVNLTPAQAHAEVESLIQRLALAMSENSENVRRLVSEGIGENRHD
jgi:hypothetical protein